VCFSDEAKVQIMDERHKFVRRRPGELLADCVKQSVKYTDKIMVCIVVSWKGAGPLPDVNGTMPKEQYMKVLDKCIFPRNARMISRKDGIFMQAGAPCRTAKAVMNYLQSNNVEVLVWPGNSSNMNPVENIWE
jgi:hypothetical protein